MRGAQFVNSIGCRMQSVAVHWLVPDQFCGDVAEQRSQPCVVDVKGNAGARLAGRLGSYWCLGDVLEVASAQSFDEGRGCEEYGGRRALLDALAALDRCLEPAGVLLQAGGDRAGVRGIGPDAIAVPAPGRLDGEHGVGGL